MADQISFRGVVIFDGATNGAGYQVTPGSLEPETIENRPSQGIGYWLKRGNVEKAEHRIEVQWRTSDPAALKAVLDALVGPTLGALVVPVWGTLNGCSMKRPEWKPASGTGGGMKIVQATLTFEQYP